VCHDRRCFAGWAASYVARRGQHCAARAGALAWGCLGCSGAPVESRRPPLRQVFAYQLDNGVAVGSWFLNAADDELLRLLPLLAELAAAADVRPLIASRSALHRLVHAAVAARPAAFPCMAAAAAAEEPGGRAAAAGRAAGRALADGGAAHAAAGPCSAGTATAWARAPAAAAGVAADSAGPCAAVWERTAPEAGWAAGMAGCSSGLGPYLGMQSGVELQGKGSSKRGKALGVLADACAGLACDEALSDPDCNSSAGACEPPRGALPCGGAASVRAPSSRSTLGAFFRCSRRPVPPSAAACPELQCSPPWCGGGGAGAGRWPAADGRKRRRVECRAGEPGAGPCWGSDSVLDGACHADGSLEDDGSPADCPARSGPGRSGERPCEGGGAEQCAAPAHSAPLLCA